MLRSEVLPAPFGPMIEIETAAADGERDAFHRPHPAKVLRYAGNGEVRLSGGDRAVVHIAGHDAARISSPARLFAHAARLWQA